MARQPIDLSRKGKHSERIQPATRCHWVRRSAFDGEFICRREAGSTRFLQHGAVRVSWEGECRRCTGRATGELEAEVRELFEEDSDPETTYPLRGDQLDLERLARDAVLLELPAAPLCREDCRGLCPSCGADWNEGPCGCEPAPDPRWAALDALRTDD